MVGHSALRYVMARASYLIVSLSGGNSQSRALQTGGVR